MIGRTNAGLGGGGSGLNVATGLSAPANPKENTIWVKSANAGKQYVFSKTAPSSPSAGLIWFSVKTVEGIMDDVQVYANGAWVKVDAYMYLSGAWVQISTSRIYLTNGSNKCPSVTGGWSEIRWYWDSYATGNVPTANWTDNGVVLTAPRTPGPGGLIVTNNSINLAKAKSIVIDCANVSANSWCIISKASGDSFNANEVARVQLANGTNVLDVSGVTASVYIGLVAYYQAKVTIKQTYIS